MPKKKLDFDLLEKMATKSSKSQQYIREQVSRRASKQAISSLAAQITWAKDMGLGVATALNRASADVRDEVRHGQIAAVRAVRVAANGAPRPNRQKKASV